MCPQAQRFGPAYFRKFYLARATRVVSAAEMRTRARLIAAILAQAAIPVRTILDAGCGIGLLRKPFAEVWPRARYTGLDASEYLCARYGWALASVVDYAPQRAERSAGLLRRAAVSRRSRRRARDRQFQPSIAQRALFLRIDTRGLARELRSQAHRSRRAPASRRVVPTTSASTLFLSRLRRVAAQGRATHALGSGELSGVNLAPPPAALHRAARTQPTSASCTLSPEPAPARASFTRDTTT